MKLMRPSEISYYQTQSAGLLEGRRLLIASSKDSKSGAAITVSGAKNAILPLTFASMLIPGCCFFTNVPGSIKDLVCVCQILETYGMSCSRGSDYLHLENPGLHEAVIDPSLASGTRYSVLLLGILLRLFGRARIPLPGGCRFESRRELDIHLKGFEAFGVEVRAEGKHLDVSIRHEQNGVYRMRYPSVGATLNLILFSITGRSPKVLMNCSSSPEVQDFISFLNACGANIDGNGTPHLTVIPASDLHSCNWRIIPDRIEFGTFATLAALLNVDLTVGPVIPEHNEAFLTLLSRTGVNYEIQPCKNRVLIRGAQTTALHPINITTGPYPFFPSDLQPITAVLCLKAAGISTIRETVHPGRFAYVREVRKTGAQLQATSNVLHVRQSDRFMRGATLSCKDIRGGIACLLAALISDGASILEDSWQIERGYDRIYEKLGSLGISIKCI